MELKVGQKLVLQRYFLQKDFNRFAQISRDDNPTHVDIEFSAKTRFGRTLAHGMHLYSIICRMLNTQAPGIGTLQYQQEMTYPTAVYTDEVVNFELEVIDVQKDRATINTNCLTERGVAIDGKTSVFLPGWKAGFAGENQFLSKDVTSEAKEHKGIKLGDKVQQKRVFMEKDLTDYADLTGDQNPFILDKKFAQAHGFQDVIIPGALLNGMFSYLLGTELPGRGTNWLKQNIYLPNPAYLGEEITAEVKVVRIRPDKDLFYLQDQCITSKGKVVCQAESLVMAKEMLSR
jgi:acyl dehydratase